MTVIDEPLAGTFPSSFPQDEADILLTRAETAHYLRISVASLERWAAIGEGPAFVRIGRSPRYGLREVRRFSRQVPVDKAA